MDFEIDVAVKCLDPLVLQRDPAFLARFRQEARASAQINHPNVVRVFAISECEGIHYLVMEFVDGENARQRVERKGPLAVDEALRVILGAGDGLDAAHTRGLVHRDIKPDNIFISAEGEVKIGDLGIAKQSESDSGMTASLTPMGTPRYMSPEQWRDAKNVTAAADVYSLGSTLYFLLAGTDAVPGGSMYEVLTFINDQPFPRITEAREDVPTEIESIIARCTAKNPLERYQSAGELVSAVRAFRDDEEYDLRDAEGRAQLARNTMVSPPPPRALAAIRTTLADSAGVPEVASDRGEIAGLEADASFSSEGPLLDEEAYIVDGQGIPSSLHNVEEPKDAEVVELSIEAQTANEVGDPDVAQVSEAPRQAEGSPEIQANVVVDRNRLTSQSEARTRRRGVPQNRRKKNKQKKKKSVSKSATITLLLVLGLVGVMIGRSWWNSELSQEELAGNEYSNGSNGMPGKLTGAEQSEGAGGEEPGGKRTSIDLPMESADDWPASQATTNSIESWTGLAAELEKAEGPIPEVVVELLKTGDPEVAVPIVQNIKKVVGEQFYLDVTIPLITGVNSRASAAVLIELLSLDDVRWRREALRGLFELTGRHFSFDPDASPSDRALQLTDWRSWWDELDGAWPPPEPRTMEMKREWTDPDELAAADSLQRGIRWIVGQQNPDGSWPAMGGEASPLEVTSLALRVLLGDGSASDRGVYRLSIKRGIDFLLRQQDQDTGLIGDYGDERVMYGHASATQVICLDLLASRNALRRLNAQAAVSCIFKGQNPYGGWGYEVPPDGSQNMSITAWMLGALEAAQSAGILVPDSVINSAFQAIDEFTDSVTGRVGYDEIGGQSFRIPGIKGNYPAEHGEAMTAAALLWRCVLKSSVEDAALRKKQAELLLKAPPEWDEEGKKVDMYYWSTATAAMAVMGDPYRPQWNRLMHEVAPSSQLDDGSWNPSGVWGSFGGRVYSTGLMCAVLQDMLR